MSVTQLSKRDALSRMVVEVAAATVAEHGFALPLPWRFDDGRASCKLCGQSVRLPAAPTLEDLNGLSGFGIQRAAGTWIDAMEAVLRAHACALELAQAGAA